MRSCDMVMQVCGLCYSSVVDEFCRASEEPAVSEETAQTIGERFGFADLPKLLSHMLKGVRDK